MSALHVLVMAKAPVAGLAKTRLGRVVGHEAAAGVAAAALLDTLAAATAAAGPHGCVLALAGDLAEAARGPQVRAALAGWQVVPQRGAGFDERLAHAHHDAAAALGPGRLVQVGMDTPQVTAGLLQDVGALLEAPVGPGSGPAPDAVLGRADDGGWWVLAVRDADAAHALRGVAMSTFTTHDDTRAALEARGLVVAAGPPLRDVDELADADAVAASAPQTRFAAAWAAVSDRARTGSAHR